MSKELTTLGGGCFWCLEPVFAELRGVDVVTSGYSGGAANATYEEVCSGRTGHAEVVQIAFDPQSIGFDDLLRVFFTVHDPTTLNRQGADMGTQYRSAIFYHNDAQREIAEQVMTEIETQRIWSNPLVTELAAFREFFPAEEYHQNYFERNPNQGYCCVVIAPKVAKFRKLYAERLK